MFSQILPISIQFLAWYLTYRLTFRKRSVYYCITSYTGRSCHVSSYCPFLIATDWLSECLPPFLETSFIDQTSRFTKDEICFISVHG